MGNTHDDDEVEIDLRELFYALKRKWSRVLQMELTSILRLEIRAMARGAV